MKRALEKATNPKRVSFAVLDAHADGDPDCAGIFKDQHLRELCKIGGPLLEKLGYSVEESECRAEVLGRTRAFLIEAKSGMGPVHQRGVAGEMLRFEREDNMCLSMDSHMDFRVGWDEILLKDWASTRNEFAILTAYPMDVEMLNNPDTDCVDLCGYSLEAGIPRGRQGGNMPQNHVSPYLTMNWAAGLSFHRCHMERAVPVDWHMRWIFTGEEIDRAVRAFTNGYDLYLPQNTAVLHEYKHAKQTFQKFTDPMSQEKGLTAARERLHSLFQTGDEGKKTSAEEFGKFGLGTQRSLEDYVRWSGVNFGGQWPKWMKDNSVEETPEGHAFCRNLPRLPVKDQTALLESIGVRPASDVPGVDGQGHVILVGDDEVHPLQLI